MNRRDILIDLGYEDSVVFDGPSFDDVIVGVTHDGRVVYSFDKMVESLMSHDGMGYEEAVEYIEFNTLRSLPYYSGGPVVMMCEDMFRDDED